MIVVSLCDLSGVWSQPYADAGNQVIRVDTQHAAGVREYGNVITVGADIRDAELPSDPDIVLAAPPCTCFCRPAACRWKGQDANGKTANDVSIFLACIEYAKLATKLWALENPPGRHHKVMPELERHAWQFQPYEYGDNWTKQTYIWGTAVKPPVLNHAKPTYCNRQPNGRITGHVGKFSSNNANERAKTPPGFAAAFYQSNH